MFFQNPKFHVSFLSTLENISFLGNKVQLKTKNDLFYQKISNITIKVGKIETQIILIK